MADQQENTLRLWVWLAQVFGAGSLKLLSYLQELGSAGAVYDAMMSGTLWDLPKSVQKGMTVHSLSEADSIVYYCRTHDIYLIPIDSPQYPEMLRHIGGPPVLLTAMGNLSLLENPLSVSIVGTRRPSEYTEKVTAYVVSDLAKSGYTIISGCAKGIDSIAHQAALDAGGTTIGVLGCGVNVNYPRENQQLRERFLTSGKGLLISEYMPGTQPVPANFPKRNRILSGLGYAAAVMEAAARSGSLITAQCAADQGRYLFCVPPANIFDPRYAGVIPLLRDGAIPLMSSEDVKMVFYDSFPQYYYQSPDGVPASERLVFAEQPDASQDAEQLSEEPAPEPAAHVPAASAEEPEQPLPDDEEGAAIVRYLRENGDTYADDIAAALDMDLSALLSNLTMLELEGFVESLFGKQYRAV